MFALTCQLRFELFVTENNNPEPNPFKMSGKASPHMKIDTFH